ncbi:30S ribosomal protein S2 [Candidatus Saccharibacteria bacterium]|nr:30S ribosomal protein S2 [Candidatus Saccharibacteria bacterium]
MTIVVNIKELLEAGAHFGHNTSRWHPKMAPFIHSQRAGNHIIDLTKTVEALNKALAFLTETVSEGKQVLLVSTKRQAKEGVKAVAMATKMPYVTERWLGGMLTNQNTIGGRIKHLKDMESRMLSGELAARYSKLEVQRLQDEIDDMNHIYGGIKEMAAKPGAVFVLDMLEDINAVREARKLGIPIVGLADSNVNPGLADYPIPCNDDATKTIALVLDYAQQAIVGGQAKVKAPEKAEDQTAEISSETTIIKTEAPEPEKSGLAVKIPTKQTKTPDKPRVKNATLKKENKAKPAKPEAKRTADSGQRSEK